MSFRLNRQPDPQTDHVRCKRKAPSTSKKVDAVQHAQGKSTIHTAIDTKPPIEFARIIEIRFRLQCDDLSRKKGMKPVDKARPPSVTPLTKSLAMAKVRTRDTGPELIVRSLLHKTGFRFRTHKHDLPGTPDIVLKRHRLAIFVHGCFWHGHEGCRRSYLPVTRREFWQAKIARNAERDAKVLDELSQLGWRYFVVWGCETKNSKILASRLAEVLPISLPTGFPDKPTLRTRANRHKTKRHDCPA